MNCLSALLPFHTIDVTLIIFNVFDELYMLKKCFFGKETTIWIVNQINKETYVILLLIRPSICLIPYFARTMSLVAPSVYHYSKQKVYDGR